MTKILVDDGEVTLVVMDSEICIEALGYRVHLTAEQWEAMVRAWNAHKYPIIGCGRLEYSLSKLYNRS